MTKITKELLRSLPKAELHCHLDGSMRVQTIIELAQENKVNLPETDPEKLKKILVAGPWCTNLVDYLRPFDITTSVLQTEEALIRATYELAQDAAEENVRYLEIRFSPLLHINKGLSLTQVTESVLKGKEQAERDFNIIIGVIICGLRHFSPEKSLQLAELTVAFKNSGVVGFDLAGAEANFPAKDHIEAFYLITNNNINTTAHAGEAYGPESIEQAIHYINANRIGHGTRLRENGDLLNYVNDHRIPLEMCITSNVQTKAVKDLASHPVKFYHNYGLRITLNTDNRLISGVTLTDEYDLAVQKFDFTQKDINQIIINGFKSAFLPYREKSELIKKVLEELKEKDFLIA